MDLTAEEIAFVRKHGFDSNEIFDGRWLSKVTRERGAREANQVLILTSVFCRAARHRIRTRGGHCAQCKPASIGFTRRERSAGYVYIAGSLSGRLLKIGMASDLSQRERQLRAESYGGFSDWEILVFRAVDDAGIQERNVASRVPGERVLAYYIKDGEMQLAKEMVRCAFRTALTGFETVLGKVPNPVSLLRRHSAYNFD
jgi:hypothetical protein